MATFVDPEKNEAVSAQHNEHLKPDESPTPPRRDLIEMDKSTEKKLIRRIDIRLLPILGLLYSIALIDRVNISAARISGMEEDLELYIGDRYTIALVVFFIPYLLLELPSNIILRKVGTANWLAFLAFSWGTVLLGSAWAKNWETLVVQRLLIGAFESGFFPGSTYLITCWYTRYEVQQRLAWFYLLSVFVGSCTGVLAYGLTLADGTANLRGWQWIFLVMGLMTQVVAIGAWFLIVDFPDKAHRKGLLTEHQAKFIEQRIEIDRGDSIPDPVTWKAIGKHAADFKLWVFALMFMSVTTPAYALAYFSPVIILGMGYTAANVHLLGIPPSVFAVVVSLVVSWLSDKYKLRAPAIILQASVCIGGLMMTAYSSNDLVRYFGLFLGGAGCQGNIPSILAYQANNIRGQSKRAVGSAMQIGFGAIGGIIGSTVFFQEEAPRYLTGLWITAGLQFFIITCTCSLSIYFYFMNRKVNNGTIRKHNEGQEGFKFTY